MPHACGMRGRTFAGLWMLLCACPEEGGATTETMGPTTAGAAGTTTGGGTTGVTATTGEAPTTSGSTGSSTGGTTAAPVEYCHGFDVRGPMPFLDLYVLGGDPLMDGGTLPLECAGTGTWMFGLYPACGGWVPASDTLTFTVEVDVEGFDAGPMGHFFRAEVPYYIGCMQFEGGLLGVLPVVPPMTVMDPSVLDDKPATVRVSVPAGGQTLAVERKVRLAAPKDEVGEGCPGA